ncbi:carcinoembryonic antigen-related cell adhesion molecule 20-like [Megalops cyprinoides]|uniref:carcinoembryonic antigen-related cell adhesion molecule 20-like n=1 Tax=Megalops cyprinoides TaxID=118141 RepID=UPI001864DB20|nr:carcinoembryonic antigen-related cell adhesion molecule 20-like [Megalops cyprinoides]
MCTTPTMGRPAPLWAFTVLALTGATCLLFPLQVSAFGDTKPLFVRITGPDRVTAGEKAKFECSAYCTPPCNYTWSLGGGTSKGPTVTLYAAGGKDTLDLDCIALNPTSKETTKTTTTIKVTNVLFVRPVSDKEPALSDPFSLTCAGSIQLSAVLWYKDGEVMTGTAETTLSADNSTLSFGALLPNHQGFYQCVVSANGREIIANGYSLVYGSLSVSISGPDTIEVGKEYVFECMPNCSIGCSVSWTFRGGFPPAYSFSLQKTVIKWVPSEPTTQLLTCVASNTGAARKATATKTVKVINKPSDHTDPPESGSEGLKPAVILCLAFTTALLVLLAL